MADFNSAVEKTLRWEGGKTTDTGGFTNFGVSHKAYPGLDIENLTRDGAKSIYKRDYWEPLNLDAVLDQASASALFDFAVNAGISRAKAEAQAALQGAGIQADKGAGLVPAINHLGAAFATALTNRRIDFYRALAAKNPSKYGSYLAGWEKRARSFFSGAAGLAQAAALSPMTWAVLAAALAGGIWYYNRTKRA